jgi:chromosome partitioning protein
MGIIISIALRKGGSAKTTTAVNLCAELAHQQKKVLLIDLDPQADATSDVGLDANNYRLNARELFVPNAEPAQLIYATNFGFDIIPAHPDLAVYDAGNQIRPKTLFNALSKIRDQYDYIIIDTPAGEGHLSINIFSATDYVIITFQTDRRPFDGINRLFAEIDSIREGLNPDIKILGLLPTLHYKVSSVCKAILQHGKEVYPGKVFDFEIEYTSKLKESSAYGMPLRYKYPGDNKYTLLANKVMEL